MRLNRATGDAFAEGNVKTTYNDLEQQPGGALLSSSSPIHVTARSMSVHRNVVASLFTLAMPGSGRMPTSSKRQSIEFDRDHRSMVAGGTSAVGSAASQTVSTVLVQADNVQAEKGQADKAQTDGSQDDKSKKPTLIAIRSARLTYADNERKAHFDGDVVAREADVTITAKQDGRVSPGPRALRNQSLTGAGKLDKIVATGAGRDHATRPPR